ncbi:ATP synthase F0 subunit C [Bacteroidales bacterium OttesenSCG-928-K03]|nr:ATP synthase F0 subunit C [Odoribacter sp. OttesenSCG-928-L07]MDL2239036.1 ATP synthase F0 subunit C [Bacteroidales bacterium OttesenSCG-928-L14]MDL2240308.1 ATP synthase F0 subunit C [Bacteroidales bacterium OttesenSCG-928-K22]MDL2242872.1 ATP synthase F0 subunit C [Bacteroidales bacterium OttesenSCG-928-K03]
MSLLSVLMDASVLGAGLATLSAAIVVVGAAFGISKIGASALDAISRQPQAANDIRMSMIVVAALIEGAALFAIVVCLLAL